MVLLTAAAADCSSAQCILITGAGSDDANGVYVPTGKKWHDADVYENDAKCLLSREPHRNSKTGEMSYGWILGQDRKPLYAVQTSDMMPPVKGWRKFKGLAPLPELSGPQAYVEAAHAAAESLKQSGNSSFAAHRYSEAEVTWTRALGFTSKRDTQLQVALFANRAEVRLRLSKFDAALSDAQEALKCSPCHDKALLRAAVAAREMKMYREAYDFVQKCLQINPAHIEAKVMLKDLEYLTCEQSQMTGAARRKMEDSMKLQEAEQQGSKLGIEDLNMLSGVKAFQGYGEQRDKAASTTGDRPPLSSLPYHRAGLAPEEVEVMDRFFQEQRDKADLEKAKARKEKENYGKVKEQYKTRAAQDVKEGRLAAVEEILGKKPSVAQSELAKEPPKSTPLICKNAEAKTGAIEKVSLSVEEKQAIDKLFEGLPTKDLTVVAPLQAASSRRKQLEAARAKMVVAC